MESEFSELEIYGQSLDDQNIGKAVCITVFCHSTSNEKLMQVSYCG